MPFFLDVHLWGRLVPWLACLAFLPCEVSEPLPAQASEIYSPVSAGKTLSVQALRQACHQPKLSLIRILAWQG